MTIEYPVKLTFENDKTSLKKSQKEVSKGNKQTTSSPGKSAAIGGAAGGLVGGFVGGLLSGLEPIQGVLKIIGNLLSALVAPLVPLITPLLKPVLVLFNLLGGFLLKFFKDPAGSLKGLAEFLIGKIGEIFGFSPDDVQGLLGNIFAIIDGVIGTLTGVWDLLKAVFTGDWSAAAEALGKIFSSMGETSLNILALLWNGLTAIVSGILGGIDSVLGTNLKAIWDNIVSIFETALDFLVAFFTGDWQGAWEALKKIGAVLLDLLINISKNSFAILIGIGTFMWNTLKSIFSSSFRVLSNLGSFIKEKILSFFSGAGGKIKSFFANDAIITPQGNLIRTNPSDFLVATKNPGSLGGGGNNITVNVQGVLDDAMINTIGQKIHENLRMRGGF